MAQEISSTAMVLAAGLGKRMGEITKNTPKPLVPIGDSCCLDIAVNALKNAGFKRLIINTHYLADQIEQFIKRYNNIEIILSYEPVLLETAGGVRKVFHEFEGKSIVVVNADMYWKDSSPSLIKHMAKAMQPQDDFCLGITPLANTQGYTRAGDFVMEGGYLKRLIEKDPAETRYVYMGVQIINSKVIEPLKVEPLSLQGLYFQASENKKLRGVIYNGPWIDVGNAEGLRLAREASSAFL